MLSREIVKIQQNILRLNLNLEGFEVLTEVGSGLYNYMPIIPLLAGAKKVMAWTRDSRHGTASDIIENCRKFNVNHLMYASSSSVYGLNKKTPFAENHITDNPANLYGASKKSNELVAFSYSNLYSLP